MEILLKVHFILQKYQIKKGNWENGQVNGFAVFKKSSGGLYKGEWKNNQ